MSVAACTASTVPARPTTTSSASEHHAAHSHGDPHVARHGGKVVMVASPGVHLHAEIVTAPSGEVRIYPADAEGTPIDVKDVTGTITCERGDTHDRTQRDARPDPTEGALVVECGPLPPESVLGLDLRMRGIPFVKSVPVEP
jgi:hypothetical protein